MARQRFIHPSLWDDTVIGPLQANERLLFIGLFSLADDEGRIEAHPAYLRSRIFTYQDEMTVADVRKIRDNLISACKNVIFYSVDDQEYIQLAKWHSYQKPKYPSPSKIPHPLADLAGIVSGNPSPILPETFSIPTGSLGKSSPRVSPLGLGMDRDRDSPPIPPQGGVDETPPRQVAGADPADKRPGEEPVEECAEHGASGNGAGDAPVDNQEPITGEPVDKKTGAAIEPPLAGNGEIAGSPADKSQGAPVGASANDGGAQRQKASGNGVGEEYPAWFETLWSKYPRRVGKQAAWRVVRQLAAKGAVIAELSDAAGNYAAAMRKQGRSIDRIKHAATFYGSDDWWKEYVYGIPDGDQGPAGVCTRSRVASQAAYRPSQVNWSEEPAL